jgi:hypothetical protein
MLLLVAVAVVEAMLQLLEVPTEEQTYLAVLAKAVMEQVLVELLAQQIQVLVAVLVVVLLQEQMVQAVLAHIFLLKLIPLLQLIHML